MKGKGRRERGESERENDRMSDGKTCLYSFELASKPKKIILSKS